jgi:hypothetical protein
MKRQPGCDQDDLAMGVLLCIWSWKPLAVCKSVNSQRKFADSRKVASHKAAKKEPRTDSMITTSDLKLTLIPEFNDGSIQRPTNGWLISTLCVSTVEV